MAMEATTGDALPASSRREDPRTAAAVARGRDGDRDAVGFLYERYAGGVHQLAHRMLGDRDGADDVTQTVFLRLLTKLDRYEPRERPFEVWLLRVTRNAALDELRRRRVKRAEPVALLAAPPAEALGIDAPLMTALARLPISQREVAVLRLVVGLSATETASRLGRTEASVNNLYLRARATLRRVLTSLGAAPATVRSAQDGPGARSGGRDGPAGPGAGRHDSGKARRTAGARRPSGPRPLRPWSVRERRTSLTSFARLAAGPPRSGGRAVSANARHRVGAHPARGPEGMRSGPGRTRSPPALAGRTRQPGPAV
jgi:RNA polymerase sigma-70 factor (ECF subfamily)